MKKGNIFYHGFKAITQNSKEDFDETVRLSGIKGAKSMGFTHTNPAQPYFNDDNQTISRKPKSAVKETK
jgi:hypothetical protein